MWGSTNTFGRVHVVKEVINNLDLYLLNTRSVTFFNMSSTFSNIDLSLYNASTGFHLTWKTLDSLHDSNHFPILITDNTPKISHNITKWRIKQTDWFEFGLNINQQLSEFALFDNIDESVEHLTGIITSGAGTYVKKYSFDYSRRIFEMVE